jgi:hypothetical protein
MPNQENVFNKYALPIGVLILIALAVGGWYLYQSSRNEVAAVGAVAQEFNWRLTPEQTPQGVQTTVVLRIADVEVPVGVYPGACEEVDGTERELLENELAGVICLEPNTVEGVEIGVFQEGTELVMMQGEVDGTERSNFAPITGQ